MIKLELTRHTSEKCSNVKFHENPPSGGAESFHADRQTDRHDAALCRFSQFGERASKRVEYKMSFTTARNRVGIRTTYVPNTNLQLIVTIKHQLRTLLLGVPQLISVIYMKQVSAQPSHHREVHCVATGSNRGLCSMEQETNSQSNRLFVRKQFVTFRLVRQVSSCIRLRKNYDGRIYRTVQQHEKTIN